MAYFGSNPALTPKGKSKKQVSNDGGVPTAAKVKQIINQVQTSPNDSVFYEFEPAEVMFVYDTEEKLPKDNNGNPIYPLMGCVKARKVESERNKPVTGPLRIFTPLHPYEHQLPVKGEYIVVMDYMDVPYYTTIINLLTSTNSNVRPGKSGARPDEVREEDYIYEHFEITEQGFDPKIKRLQPYEGDYLLQGRWGHSIRFGSNIVPDAHEDGDSKQDSPNILFRAGQLNDASDFGKGNELSDLSIRYKPVKEDINADGSSIWMTTDQSVKLDIKNTNASDHSYMTSLQSDDQPTEGGKQITINSDRITFNTKKGKILGFSADGIGFSTKKSFSVDADNGLQMNSGGATSMGMIPGGISLVTPGNSRLDLGAGADGEAADEIYLSSECPSFLKLDDMAHLESCKGANVHLDDCAGLYTDNGSYFKIGGSNDEAVIYVKGRDDVKQQHLVFGEKLTEILDLMLASQEALIDTVMSFAGIPTGAGPSGPISGGPPNQALVDAFKTTQVETIRAQICDILTRVEK
jgi:hypothetical protein|tara:strand:+ start:953 stop:2515 length:1563 start_codon:yes stop_codon:yes gene_type:complete